MKISVLIPTYNSAKTIEATLNSVLAQTHPLHEILIMDDGSTDNTVQLLNQYVPRVTVLQQRNQGVAQARNVLCERATGDLLAFLDHDDIWHPKYIAAQGRRFSEHPDGVAFFTGHDDFYGYGGYNWNSSNDEMADSVEKIQPVKFIQRYHKAIGPFASMSFCCIPKHVFNELGSEPFCKKVSGVDDFYLFHTLTLLGPIWLSSQALVAYRITPGAQSASLLKLVEKAVMALELLESRFQNHPDFQLKKAFYSVYAAQRREYGRVLMGTGQSKLARQQLWISMSHSYRLTSLMKSLVLLFLTRVPNWIQPRWPSEWKASHSEPREEFKLLL